MAAKRNGLSRFVDVEGVSEGLVKLKNGKFVAAIEVEGEFFKLLRPEEQDRRILSFGSMLNAIKDPVQLTVYTEPLSMREYENKIKTKTADSDIEAIRELGKYTADLVEDLSREILEEHYVFSISEYTEVKARSKADRLVKALQIGGFSIRRLKNDELVKMVSVGCGQMLPESPEVYLGGFNRGSRLSSLFPSTEKKKDPLKGKIETPIADNAPDLTDLLAPSALIESPGLLDLGGVYARTMIAVAWPSEVETDWLSPILHYPYMRRISFYIDPIPRQKAVAEINRQIQNLESNVRAAHRGGKNPDQYQVNALEDATDLRRALARGTISMFNVSMLVTLMGPDKEELAENVENLKQEAASSSLVLRECWLNERLAFQSTLPLDGRQFVPKPRPVPTDALASTFPFTAGELIHDDGDGGQFLGLNLITENAVIMDPDRLESGHMIVVAATRSGKSFAFKWILTQSLFDSKTDVYVIDPSPPIDYERLTRALNGEYVVFGVGENVRVNPCEIWLPPSLKSDTLKENQRPVTSKVAFLKTLIELMVYNNGSMPDIEKALLETPLKAMYEERGFDDSWEGVIDHEADSLRQVAKKSPTLDDMYEHIRKTEGLEELALKLRPFVQGGTLDMFSGETNVDLEKRMVVFNVYHLVANNPHLAPVAYFMLTEIIRSRMLAETRRKVVGIDEAHVLFQNAETALFVSRLYRMAAKQGGRVAMMTQSITDLVGDMGVPAAGAEHARVCLSQSQIALLLRNDKENDLRLLNSVFNVSEAEQALVRDADRGQGLLIAGRDRVAIQIVAPDELYPFITSDPNEVNELFEEEGADIPLTAQS